MEHSTECASKGLIREACERNGARRDVGSLAVTRSASALASTWSVRGCPGGAGLVAADEATAAIGLLTVSFVIGQSLGRVFGGALADTSAGLRLSLGLAGATLLATAAVLAAANRPREAGRALS
jgi:hypothetical protein